MTITGATTHKASEGMIAYNVGEKWTQTIKASKMESAKRDYSIEVNKNFTQEIGGALVILCGKNLTDGSDEKTTWTIKSDWRGLTKHVHLEAKKKITLKVGSSTIVMDEKGHHRHHAGLRPGRLLGADVRITQGHPQSLRSLNDV